ncbi:MAG: hypothetical protein F2796_02820 [Actinobacteria bacterium]|nr:hypothetical protein [Actinomycetota bacterium]
MGASLREARRALGVDITEVEADTKIRGKYLRALENEEWDLLPGPTFVKSFLRTYADHLGLDGRLLVEEFKVRYERPQVIPITPGTQSGQRERRRYPGPRFWLIAGLVALLILGLVVLGTSGRGSGSKKTSEAAPAHHVALAVARSA